MTNTNTNPVVNEAEESAKEPKKNKNVFARILAALFAALCVGVVFLPFIHVVSMSGGAEKMSILDAVKRLFVPETTDKLFGFLPTFMGTNTDGGVIATLSFYLLALSLVCSFILGFITIFCSKKALAMLRTTTFFFANGFGLYALCTLLYTHLHAEMLLFDIVFLALMGVGALTYAILSIIRNGKTAVMNIFMYVLSLVAGGALILVAKDDDFALANVFAKIGLGDLSLATFDSVKVVIFFVLVAFIVIASLRIMMKKGRWIDVVCSVILFLVAVALLVTEIMAIKQRPVALIKYLVMALVATAITLTQFFISVSLCRKKKTIVKIENVEIEEAEIIAEEGETVASEPAPAEEESVEAVAYEGGPVGGVEMAEEAAPSSNDEPNAYSGQTFDAFIATLNNAERQEFIETFVVKYNGEIPGVPTYVVGGDNKVFFTKCFVQLVPVRDKISAALFEKIYQFASKKSA